MKKIITVMLSISVILNTVSVFAAIGEDTVSDNCVECESLTECEEVTECDFENEIVIDETEEIAYVYDDIFEITDEEIVDTENDVVLEIEEIEGADMAASCKHEWNTTYSNLGEKHQITKTCSKCGRKKTSKGSHLSDGSKSYSQIDGTYHNVTSKCKTCGQNFTKKAKHNFINAKCKHCGYVNNAKCKHSSTITSYQANDALNHYIVKTCKTCGVIVSKKNENHSGVKTISATKANGTMHNAVKTCRKCNQKYTVSEKHSFSSGKCKTCGYKPSYSEMSIKNAASKIQPTPRPSTTCASSNGSGQCIKLLKSDKGKIYAKCPKCGANGWDSEFIKWKKIKHGTILITHETGTIYHQYVKCNNCGKKYYNYCKFEKD